MTQCPYCNKDLIIPLMTIREAAAAFGWSFHTLQKKVNRREVPVFMNGTRPMINPVVFQEWLDENTGLPQDKPQTGRGRRRKFNLHKGGTK